MDELIIPLVGIGVLYWWLLSKPKNSPSEELLDEELKLLDRLIGVSVSLVVCEGYPGGYTIEYHDEEYGPFTEEEMLVVAYRVRSGERIENALQGELLEWPDDNDLKTWAIDEMCTYNKKYPGKQVEDIRCLQKGWIHVKGRWPHRKGASLFASELVARFRQRFPSTGPLRIVVDDGRVRTKPVKLHYWVVENPMTCLP